MQHYNDYKGENTLNRIKMRITLISGILCSIFFCFSTQKIVAIEKETNYLSSTQADSIQVLTNAALQCKKELKTAKVRLIFTTDLHGQLTTTDYELGKKYEKGSLAKAYTLIKKAREEVAEENYLTFDVGDSFYDYTTEYIYAEASKKLQPIYKGMQRIGYDAITLGNHDFDYGYDFIFNQLKQSGLLKKTIVSNLRTVKTGEHPFGDSKIIKKKIRTTNGDRIDIKMGIIGETIPTLSTKTENYESILEGEDIVSNVKRQAALLKRNGAELIIVLAHSGFGTVQPEEKDKNVVYALSKIKEVDVILCGHEHNAFPNQEQAGNVYTLPHIHKKSGLMNGTRVVMSLDRGRGIGVVDLNIQQQKGQTKLLSSQGEVRRVNETKTKADTTINQSMQEWHKKLLTNSKRTVATLKGKTRLENYFLLLEDSNAMQLLNNAKISYAKQCIHSKYKQYKKYPIVAISRYLYYGEDGARDYVDLSKEIKSGELSKVQVYNKYLILYRITGAQLKEWLEWSASGYEYITKEKLEKAKDKWLKKYATENQTGALTLNNWSSIFICDGVEYTIDLTSPPRYNQNGTKINNTNRICTLNCNGIPIKDEQIFILATDKIMQPKEANAKINEQAIAKGYRQSQTILKTYLEQLDSVGAITLPNDYNWNIRLPKETTVVVKVSQLAREMAKEKAWLIRRVGAKEGYDYYLGKIKEQEEDKIAPNIVLALAEGEKSQKALQVLIHATDFSGIKYVKYAYGEHMAEDAVWEKKKALGKASFQTNKTGIYTVLAEDNKGNKAIARINAKQ